jgi:hypothetical protein
MRTISVESDRRHVNSFKNSAEFQCSRKPISGPSGIGSQLPEIFTVTVHSVLKSQHVHSFSKSRASESETRKTFPICPPISTFMDAHAAGSLKK